MFGLTTNEAISDLETTKKYQKERIEQLKADIKAINLENRNETDRVAFAHKKTVENLNWEIAKLKDKAKIEEGLKEDDINAKVEKATSEAVAAKQVAETEAKCYRGAIKAVGLDTKDMKEMMIKMVDGLSTKAELNVISTNNGNSN